MTLKRVIGRAERHRRLLLAVTAGALALFAAAPGSALGAADLHVTASDAPDPALPGELVTITATVKNNGDDTAYDVQVSFGSITNASLANAQGCQSFGPGSNYAACGVGNIAPDQTRTAAITIKVADDVPVSEASLYVNASFADVNGDPVIDPTPADNQVQVTTTVEPRADLKLEMSAVSPVTIGNNSALTATVTNTLNGTARGTLLQFVVPPELPVASLPQGCSLSGLRISCDVGQVGPQSTATRVVVFQVPTEGSFIVIGSVSWSKPDATPADAQWQSTITGLAPVEPEGGGPPPAPVEKPKPARPQDVPISLITSGVPSGRRCIRTRSLSFKLRRPSGIPLTQADVYLGTRRVKRITGALLRRTVVLGRLPRGRYRVTVVVSVRDGGRLRGHRSLKGCR